MCFGPFLYTWATTPWAHNVSNPSQSLTGQWVGLAAVADPDGHKPRPVEGVGDVDIKLELHLKLLSLSRAVVGTVLVCDGKGSDRYDVLSGMLGEEGHFSAFLRKHGGKTNIIGSLDSKFSPGLLVLQEGNMAAVLRKGTDSDFQQQCSKLLTGGTGQ